MILLRRATAPTSMMRVAILGAIVLAVFMVNASAASASVFPTVDAGPVLTCGVKSDTTAVCWDHSFSFSPFGSVKSVSASDWAVCGVRSDDTLACEELNASNAAPPAGSFKSVSVGLVHACAVKSDATVECWGDNSYGQATPPAGSFESVSAGAWHTCGVRSDATVACWGDNRYGRATPPLGRFESVSAGDSHTCGVRSDATVACWGDNQSGQSTPPAGSFRSVSAGLLATCGVRSDDTIACWGENGSGQSTPPIGRFESVSVSNERTCGVRSDATVACWGYGTGAPPADAFPPADWADVSVSVAAPPSVRTRWTMNYAITVANDGPMKASNVVLTNQLPPGTTFQEASVPAGWTCTFPPRGKGGLVTCTVPSMDHDTTAASSLLVKVTAGPNKGPLVNEAQVTNDTSDPDLTNNSATTSTDVTR